MKINTTHGEVEESELVKREGSVDNDNEYTTWVEYYLCDELVHRSAHVRLKQVSGFSELASFGGE